MFPRSFEEFPSPLGLSTLPLLLRFPLSFFLFTICSFSFFAIQELRLLVLLSALREVVS
jgi:hypothetical protein